MKKIFTLILIAASISASAQKTIDRTIIVKVDNTDSLYERVKYALVNSEFQVKDNGRRDTLSTYVMEYNKIFCKAIATIDGNTVTLYGYYGLKKINDLGFTHIPKGYKRILYLKKGIGWNLLMDVANRIGGEISYL